MPNEALERMQALRSEIQQLAEQQRNDLFLNMLALKNCARGIAENPKDFGPGWSDACRQLVEQMDTLGERLQAIALKEDK